MKFWKRRKVGWDKKKKEEKFHVVMEKERYKQETEFYDNNGHIYIPRKSHRKETFYSTKFNMNDTPINQCTEEIYERAFFLLTSTPVTSHEASVISTSSIQPFTTITQQSVLSTTIVRSTDNLNTVLMRSMDNPCSQFVRPFEPELVYSNSVSYPKLAYSLPCHTFETNHGTTATKVHISKDTPSSSGVASAASSDVSEDACSEKRECHHSAENLHKTLLGHPNDSSTNRNDPSQNSKTNLIIEQKKEFKTQGTQTDHSISCPCPCVYSKKLSNEKMSEVQIENTVASLNSSQDANRRDSGFSSPDTSSQRTSLSPKAPISHLSSICEDISRYPSNSDEMNKRDNHVLDENNNFNSVNVIVNEGSHSLKHRYDEAKERYLQVIKQTSIDPKKELYLLELKKRLLKNRIRTLDHEEDVLEWEPIIPVKNPRKSGLKNNVESELAKTGVNKFKHLRKHTGLSTKDLINAILQVRQCLDIVKKYSTTPGRQLTLEHKVHQKIQLHSYLLPHKQHKTTQNAILAVEELTERESCKYAIDNKNESNDEETNCFPCSKKSKKDKENMPLLKNTSASKKQSTKRENLPDLHSSAVAGDVRSLLTILQSQSIDVNLKDSKGQPPIHHALKNNHYRTAILLLEAGANIKEYTQEKIREFKKIQEIIEKNKKDITS